MSVTASLRLLPVAGRQGHLRYLRQSFRFFDAGTRRASLEPRFDGIEAGLQILDLTRFLDANRFPLRLKTL